VREEPDVNDASREMTPNTETLDDTRSVDLDIQSEVSDREVNCVYLLLSSLFLCTYFMAIFVVIL
jgi:hypothetical protein